MRLRKRRRLSALFCLVFLLTGCRKSDSVSSPPSWNGGTPEQQQETVLTNVYRGTVLNLPEDCAKKIQSRVSIWLAEHR